MPNETLIFGADDSEGYRNLWGYNPVTGNVAPVSLSNPGSTGGPPRYDLYDLNGKIIASYVTEDDIPQIGYFNGTEVEFIGSATQNNFDPELDNFIEYGGDLYFTLEPNGSDRAIIKYDPVAGTLTNITEGSLFEAGTQRLVVFDDGSGEKLYFDAEPNDGDLRTLYRWDGTNIEAAPNFSGTDEVADMAVFNGAIYISSTPLGKYDFNNYAATNTYDDNRLYKYDGASVTQVKDFSSEVNVDPYIQEFTLFDNKLFFTATYFSSGTGGRIYSIDAAGTITTEYTAYSDASTSGTPGNLTIHNGELYFSVRLYNSGSETDIYKYNSTGSATNLTSGIAGYSDSDLKNLMSYENGLIYQQDAGQGDELQYLNLLDNTITQLTDINDTGDSLQNNSADSPFIVYQGNIAPLVNAMDKSSVVSKNAGSITVNPDLEVFEIDDNVIKSAQVSFDSGFQAGDALAVTDMHGITSSFNASTGLLTLTGQASPEQYQAILRTLTFDTTSMAGERVLLLQATDSNDKISSSTAASGFYTFDVVDGDVSSFSYDSQPAGVPTESDGTYVGSFSITDANLGNVTYKVTEGSLATDFASLTEAFDANNYGIQYNSVSQSLEVQADTDTYEAPDYLAIKFDNAAHFYGFKANDPDNYSYDKFIVTGFKNGTQVAQETFTFSGSMGLGLNIKTSVAGFQSVDEIRINPDALNYPAETGFGTFFDDLIFVTSTPVPTVSIALAGGANANDASVDFVATFSESVSNVSTDDFELTLTGSASGSIASVSGSGTTYTITVNNLSGDGAARLDLKAGTDIVNGDGGTPEAYTSGGSHALDLVAPTVSTGNITLSGATGANGEFIVGDTVTVEWDNSASGDNNGDIAGVTVDFSEFGGGSAVSASLSGSTYTATYTITSGNLDASDRNVAVTATDDAGNATTTTDTSNVSVDNDSPTVTDGNISITTTGSGTGGAFITGDTVTLEWNNSTDSNSDLAGVTADFSAFGGGTAVAMSDVNSDGTLYRASYVITSGTVDATNLNASVTATDNAGNTTTTADTSNLTTDNQAPTVTDGSLTIIGGSGTGGAFIVGDTVTANWDNTNSGDDNGDISSATVDFSAFGGGAAVAASNSSGTWTATYTITEDGGGSIDGTGKNISLTAIDDVGLTATTADTTGASVDNDSPGTPTGTLAVDENSANNTTVGTVSGGGSDGVIYSLTDNASGRFAIDANTGAVTVADGSLLDHESNASHNITVRATDDAGNATDNTLTVTVNDVNEAATLANLNGDSVSFAIGGNPVTLDTSGDAAVADVDSADFDSGNVTVSITANGQSTEDVLSVGSIGAISLSGSDVVHSDGSGTIIGSVSGGSNGNDLVISLNASATQARVQDLVRALQYTDTDTATTNTAARTVRVTLNDGDGATSAHQDVTINLVRAPIIDLDGDDSSGATDEGFSGSFTEGTPAAAADSDSTISDDGSFKSLTITLTNRPDGAAESLASTYGGGAQTVNSETVTIGSYDSNTGALTITIDDSSTDASTMLMLMESIRYDNSSDDPNTSDRIITFSAIDNDDNTGSNATATLSITPVNDAPALTTTGSGPTFTEGGIAASLFTGTSIDAIETVDNISSLTLTVTNLADGGDEKLSVDGESITLTNGTSGTTTASSFSYSVVVSGTTATVTLTKDDSTGNWQLANTD